MGRFKVRYNTDSSQTQWKVQKEDAKDKKRIKSKLVQFTSAETERLNTTDTVQRLFSVIMRYYILK